MGGTMTRAPWQGPEPGGLSRRDLLARMGAAGLVLAAGPPLLAACGSEGEQGAGGRIERPNIVLVVADDMRYDQLPFMPNLHRLISDRGRAFTQARCNVALCQPSRVGYLTGQTSQVNREWSIGYSGTNLGDHDNCLGRWMTAAGYRCGFFGKYVNAVDGRGGIDAPKGYQTWREIISHEDGYHFTVHLEEGVEEIQDRYSTDYLAQEAVRFASGGGPFLAIVSPTQAHAPFSPRQDLADMFSDLDPDIADEPDMSDKPPWMRSLPPLTDELRRAQRTNAIGSLRDLAAVDDMVERIMTGMDPEVRARTVVIFSSDNGVYRGEHRRPGPDSKSGPYDVALRVPLLAAGPGFPPGAEVTAPVLAMQDVTATILDLGGAAAGLPDQAGTSLVELVANPEAHRERTLLHGIGEGFFNLLGNGVTTGPDHALGFRKLFRYPRDVSSPAGPFVYEGYDLDIDPDEMDSWADDPSRRQERDVLEAELESLPA